MEINSVKEWSFRESRMENGYKYIMGVEYGTSNALYEIVFDNGDKIGIISALFESPVVNIWHNKIVVKVNNEICFFSKSHNELLCSYKVGLSINEYVLLPSKVLVIGDVEIIKISEDLSIIWRIELSGTLQDYSFTNHDILCKLDDNSSLRIDIETGHITSSF